VKIALEELKSFNLYDGLPEKLKGLKQGEYYCFYYVPDYDNSKIKIIKDFIAVTLNASLYRDVYNVAREAKSGDVFLGYFTTRFETRDGLFYLMLNSFVQQEILSDFYAYASESDTKSEFKISNTASVDIISRDSFSNALSYFMHPEKTNTVLSIYDIVADFVKEHHKTNLYGGIIKRVVQMVFHDSGVMADENGALRFMTIGEKAILSAEQEEKLQTAKSLLRSLVNPNDVYVQTGWYYNIHDGLWRTNISDTESRLNETLVVKINDDLSIYKPLYCPVSQEQIVANLSKPDVLFGLGYNGKLSNILIHKKLYAHYPELVNLGLVFANNKAGIYYHSDSSEGGGFINIQGDKKQDHILSTLLHETQHAVQAIEGFAKGGNTTIANFVIALGGKGVRPIFASISNFQKFISSRSGNVAFYNELKSAVEQIKVSSPVSQQLKGELMSNFMSDYEKFKANANNVGFYLIYILADTKVFNEGAIIDFLEQYYGDDIYTMFEQIKDAIMSADRATQKLLSEGFSEQDTKMVNFMAYQDLLGETEARGTQHQMRIPMNLTNYFFLNEWEKSPTKSVAVIGGKYIFRDTSKIVGACEKTLDGKYILHFKKDISSIPFIHELGHIVHDILEDRGFGEIIKNEFDKAVVGEDYQEYFVNVFLGYIYNFYFDSLIGEDLASTYSREENKIIFDILSDMFSPMPQGIAEVGAYLKELEKITE